MKDSATIAGELRTEALRLEKLIYAYRHAATLLELEGPHDYEQEITGTELREARKRRVRSPESIAKQRATIARKRAQAASQAPQETRLRVLSSTKPTEAELQDREIVHATEQPA